MKKNASSIPKIPLIRLCKMINITPETTIIHAFLQLNKNKFFDFIIPLLKIKQSGLLFRKSYRSSLSL